VILWIISDEIVWSRRAPSWLGSKRCWSFTLWQLLGTFKSGLRHFKLLCKLSSMFDDLFQLVLLLLKVLLSLFVKLLQLVLAVFNSLFHIIDVLLT